MKKAGSVFQASFFTFWVTLTLAWIFPINEGENNLTIIIVSGLIVAGALAWLADKDKF